MTDLRAHPLAIKAHAAFIRRFGTAPAVLIHAPGRINLIGEHTDYNHGYVLPAAISQGICIAMRISENNTHEWMALDTQEEIKIPVTASQPSDAGWADYFLGAHRILLTATDPAIKCVFTSDLPAGAGLSSSSALTCGFLLGINTLLNLHKTREELAWLAHLVERNFIGLQGGIMDQHASLLSRRDHFLFLDCLTRTYHHIPFYPKDGVCVFLINTCVQHKLTSSDYNTRAAECRRALELLQGQLGIHTLRDITLPELEEQKTLLGPMLMQRVTFVLQENARVLSAVDKIKKRQWQDLGHLLIQSHQGLRDDYAVSCKELDFLVESVSNYPGILGARMMGGGFGGCTINIALGPPGHAFREEITTQYRRQFGWDCAFVEVGLSEGASVQALD